MKVFKRVEQERNENMLQVPRTALGRPTIPIVSLVLLVMWRDSWWLSCASCERSATIWSRQWRNSTGGRCCSRSSLVSSFLLV